MRPSALPVAVQEKPLLGCHEAQAGALIGGIHWIAALVHAVDLDSRLVLIAFPSEYSDLVHSWSTRDYRILVETAKLNECIVPIASRVNVGHLVLLTWPVYWFRFLKRSYIPLLNLVLRCVTPSQYLVVSVIQWVPCQVRPVERFHTFGMAHIPDVDNWVPASRYQGVLINEFNAKNSIWMAGIIPFGSA